MRWLNRARSLSGRSDELAVQGQRAVRVQQLALVWEVLSALGVAGSAGLYARVQAWQPLVVLGTTLICSVLCRVSRRLSLASRAASGAALLVLISVAVPVAATACVSDIVPLSAALVLVLPIGTAALAWPRRSFPGALYVGASGTALCILLNRVWPWDRVDVADLSIYVFPMMALAAAGVAALLWSLADILPGGSLRTRLLFAFLLLAAFPVIVAWIAITTRHWFPNAAVLPAAIQAGPGALGPKPAMWAWMLSLGLGGVAFTVAVAFRLAARIAEPFRLLARRARGLDHDGTRSPVSRGEEAEDLACALDAVQLSQQAVEGETKRAVLARTRELEERCRRAEAVAEVAAVGLSVLDVRRFCRAAVDVIRERLALQYAGLYTLSAGEPSAKLVAYSVCPGWQGPSQPSQVRIGEGLVGRSIGQAKLLVDVSVDPTVAADVLGAADSPVVSAALPLQTRGQVLGAMVVYGGHPQGLGRELLDALQTMSHVAALALDNIYALEESQDALVVAQRAAGKLSLEAWADVVRARSDLGFHGSERGVERATGSWSPRMLRAARDNATILEERAWDAAGGEHLTVPIRVGGEVIGVLDTRKPAGHGMWTTNQVALVEQVVQQLSQALENARLYEETQRRGVRERQLREIGTRIGSGVDLDTILQTAIGDVAKALGVPAAFVQLYEGGPVHGPPTE